MTGLMFSDRWRTLHTDVLQQAGVTDAACQYYKLLRVQLQLGGSEGCRDLQGTFEEVVEV